MTKGIILLVDDQPYMRRLISYNLSKAGYQIIEASNGLEGLQQLVHHRPDLIISDVMMPEMDGIEFCKKVRENSKTKMLPFVFVTAKSQQLDKLDGFKSGGDDYIVKPFDPAELIARVASIIERVKNFLELSEIDDLTKVFNRRYFDKKINESVEIANRYKRECTLAMIDIDFFKKVNDEFGHQGGDFILKRLARLLKTNIRKVDYLCRYGGEEFAIIMPETVKEVGGQILEKLRETVQNQDFFYEPKRENIKITISTGVANQPIDAGSVQSLIEKADKALYRAKDNGRNQVTLAGPEDDTGEGRL